MTYIFLQSEQTISSILCDLMDNASHSSRSLEPMAEKDHKTSGFGAGQHEDRNWTCSSISPNYNYVQQKLETQMLV